MVRDNFKNAIRDKNDILFALLLPVSYAVTLLLLYFQFPTIFFSPTIYSLAYALLFSWSRNMIEIQVYFVTKQVFNPFNRGTLTFIVPALAYPLLRSFLNSPVSGEVYFSILAVVACVIFL